MDRKSPNRQAVRPAARRDDIDTNELPLAGEAKEEVAVGATAGELAGRFPRLRRRASR